MDEDEVAKARRRLDNLTAKTALREEALGRDAFLEMPPSLKNQLSVLQAQAEPKEQTVEAIMAAEHNLREYNSKLDEAFNLRNQLVGERGRQATALRRKVRRATITIVVAGVLIGGAVFFYRNGAGARAEECKAELACAEEGMCSAQLTFEPFGFGCAARGEDCQKARACAERGACSPREGICVPLTNEDCRRARRCVENGLCSHQGGICVAANDDDCRASRGCHEHGMCLEMQAQCIAPPGFSARSSATPAPSGSAAPAASRRRR